MTFRNSSIDLNCEFLDVGLRLYLKLFPLQEDIDNWDFP